MNTLKIDVIKDGQPLSAKLCQYYGLDGRDFKISYDAAAGRNLTFANFVGIVRKGDRLLASLPKHYADVEQFSDLSYRDKVGEIKLIMSSVLEYNLSSEYRTYANSDDLESNFSLSSFYRIYDYYQKYGLYHEDDQRITRGYKGNISWKKTIKKSHKLIGGGNLIFTPFYVRKHQNNENLITQAMVFAINYTVQLFGDFLDLPSNSRIASRGIDNIFLANTDKIIGQLNVLQSHIFKDADKALVMNLIIFLREANTGSFETKYIKQYDYANLWEKAVEKYLNGHFAGLNQDGHQLLFGTEHSSDEGMRFTKLSDNGYNLAHPGWRLEPDHYWLDESTNTQYIFDSKYYTKLTDLNHKQLVYHFLFRKRAARTVDALIMPEEGETRTEKYVDLNNDWLPEADQDIAILLTHLNAKDVIQCFVQH